MAPGDRRADDAGDDTTGGEERDGAGSLLGGIPVGQVENDSGEESRLRRAEKKAHGVKHRDRLDEHHRHRDEPPDDHDPGNPDAGADALHHQVARHLEQEVADEEQSGSQPVDRPEHRLVDPEHFAQMQLGEAKVDPVDVSDDIAEEQEGDEAPVDRRKHRALPGGIQRAWLNRRAGGEFTLHKIDAGADRRPTRATSPDVPSVRVKDCSAFSSHRRSPSGAHPLNGRPDVNVPKMHADGAARGNVDRIGVEREDQVVAALMIPLAACDLDAAMLPRT